MKLSNLFSPWLETMLPEITISGLQNDSRHVHAGELFFAYPGVLADGRLFIEKAVASGAAAIAYEPENMPIDISNFKSIPCIPIPGLSSKLAMIASHFYHHPSKTLSVTGVTGTNGKTTIAYQLTQAYELAGQSARYVGTIGQGKVNELSPLANTTPDALFLQRLLYEYQQQNAQQICMEVSSHGLSQGRVESIDFGTAIYTNLTLDHLDYHHTMQAYAESKARLFATPSLRCAVINYDDEYAPFMSSKIMPHCQTLTYGLHEGSDVRALRWESSMTGSQFEVISPWGKHEVEVNLLGAFNVYNSLAIFTSLLANDIPITTVIDIMSQLRASPGRMEVVSNNPCVIVDYAHTPDALENVLITLNQLKKGRLGVVFGCGGDRDKTKRPIMGRIATQYADFVIITSDNPRSEEPSSIINDIAQGLKSTVPVEKIINREAAIHHALKMADNHDIILIAGKGHESYQLIGKQCHHFSDKEVVQKCVSDMPSNF